jgi:hypothetical protein
MIQLILFEINLISKAILVLMKEVGYPSLIKGNPVKKKSFFLKEMGPRRKVGSTMKNR